MIEGALGAHGVVPTNEAIAGIAQQQYGSQVAWIMLAGFLVSLVLARVTPLRYVFLTGHHMLFMATLITIVMASASMPTPIVIGLGSLLLGILMVSLPALAHPFTRKVTGGENIAIGHFGTSGYIASAATGRLVDPHGRSRSTEEIKRFPRVCDSCATQWWRQPCPWSSCTSSWPSSSLRDVAGR